MGPAFVGVFCIRNKPASVKGVLFFTNSMFLSILKNLQEVFKVKTFRNLKKLS